MKFCCDCKYLSGDDCMARAYSDVRTDLVKGPVPVIAGKMLAEEARCWPIDEWHAQHGCGPEAKLFKPSLLGRLRMWLREP